MLPEKIRRAGEVTVVGEPGAPWRIVTGEGAVSGMQPDILREFSRILGVEFRTKLAHGLPAVKLGVQSGRYDMAFGPLLSSTQTQTQLNFIEYTLGISGFIYLPGKMRIRFVADLCGRKFAYMSGSSIYARVFDKVDERCRALGKEPVTRLQLGNFNAIILAVTANRADFAAASAHQASYFAAISNGSLKAFVLPVTEFPADQLGMALQPGDTGLAQAVAGAWRILFENGTYDLLMAKYHISATKVASPQAYLSAPVALSR